MARDIVDRVGLSGPDDGGCRWVAVRHAPDHIHLVVTLARQDGAPARTSNDYYRVGEACQAVERRYGLTRTPGRDRTAARRPTRAETEKAHRAGRREPARVVLQREVRGAVAAAASGQEFLIRLSQAGLLVRRRCDPRSPDTVTGYAVALPGDRTRDGQPVWFGGGKLAADLSWPKLAVRWPDTRQDDRRRHGHRPSGRQHPDGRLFGRLLSGQDRIAVWRDAARLAGDAAVEVRRLADLDPAAASDIAHATRDTLAATARVIEGRRGGPLTDAADAYDRAARELHGRPSQPAVMADSLRATARLIALTGRASHDETTQLLALVANLAALAEAVADLRQAQDRHAQATAARIAAQHLRAVPGPASATSPGPPGPQSAPVHTPRPAATVHRPHRQPTPPATPRRKVLS